MNRWFIIRDGALYWPSGWTNEAGFATSYESGEVAATALEVLRKQNLAAFEAAETVMLRLKRDETTGRWVAEEPLRMAVPVEPLASEPAEETETATEHPADAPQGVGDVAEVARRERKRKITQAAQRAALARLIEDRAGRAWVRGLLTLCHLTTSSYRENTNAMYFAEGERNVGIFLLAEITAAVGNELVGALLTKGEMDG